MEAVNARSGKEAGLAGQHPHVSCVTLPQSSLASFLSHGLTSGPACSRVILLLNPFCWCCRLGQPPPQHFAVLQQHIQELTEERLHLQRALASHARVQEQLERDNEELGQRLNTQGGALEATRKLVG